MPKGSRMVGSSARPANRSANPKSPRMRVMSRPG